VAARYKIGAVARYFDPDMRRQNAFKLGHKLSSRASRAAVAHPDAEVLLNNKNGGRNPVVPEAPIASETGSAIVARQPAEQVSTIPPLPIEVLFGVHVGRSDPFDRDDPAGFSDCAG
jgi:hypothetical protein